MNYIEYSYKVHELFVWLSLFLLLIYLYQTNFRFVKIPNYLSMIHLLKTNLCLTKISKMVPHDKFIGVIFILKKNPNLYHWLKGTFRYRCTQHLVKILDDYKNDILWKIHFFYMHAL